jgi:hypothetical protein
MNSFVSPDLYAVSNNYTLLKGIYCYSIAREEEQLNLAELGSIQPYPFKVEQRTNEKPN